MHRPSGDAAASGEPARLLEARRISRRASLRFLAGGTLGAALAPRGTAAVDAEVDGESARDSIRCAFFPANNVWNARVDRLPVDRRSAAYVRSIGTRDGLHPDFGAGLWDGGPIGIPYTTVGGDRRRVRVRFRYADESDPGPYPIPPDAPIEGGPGADGDRHVLVLGTDECVLYELFDAHPQADGSWRAGSGAIFDLRSNALRPRG